MKLALIALAAVAVVAVGIGLFTSMSGNESTAPGQQVDALGQPYETLKEAPPRSPKPSIEKAE